MHNIEHILHGLFELSCILLLVGATLASREGHLSLALGMAVPSLCMLITSTASHARLVRRCRADRLGADASLPNPPMQDASAHSPAMIPSAPDTGPATPTATEADEIPPARDLTTLAAQDIVEPSVPETSPSTPQDIGPVTLPDADSSELAVTPGIDSASTEAASRLGFAALSDLLLATDDPIAELKAFVGDIRTRMGELPASASDYPCGLETYAARLLEEAGLFASDVELPHLTVVRPQPSRMVYLRSSEQRIPYLAMLRIIRLESALNAVRFAVASLEPSASEEEAYAFNQRLAQSIVAQASPIDDPLEPDDDGWPDGEWAVRYGISQAIETLQLPYRLQADFRANVADGNIALEVALTPAEAFPSSCLVEGLGIVPTTGDMRQRAAADYALRLALLLAANAFRCSPRIRHVWVAGIIENAARRTCYLSVDFDRFRFSRVDLGHVDDLVETYRSFAPVLRYEDGWLRPVKQSFHLEEERFCPTRRYLPVSLSSRRLEGRVAQSLGTDHVSGLAIEESDGRALVASAIMLRLTGSDDDHATQKNVRTVMELAGDDPDPTVRSAAERVVNGLIQGTLEEDALTIGEEFVRGDALTRACDRAKVLLAQQWVDEANRALSSLVARIDDAGTYADTPSVAYRYFASYVERALYNRLFDTEECHRTVLLVPDSYYEAHLLLSVTCLMTSRGEEALSHARRLVELAPLDARAHLHLVKCLEVADRDIEAVAQLNTLLGCAYEPMGVGFGYYRMAFFQWKSGNVEAAQACYQRAMRLLPAALPMMAMEFTVLRLQNPGMSAEEMDEQELDGILAAQGIVVAPTEDTSKVFYECARASLDAEIFPVARNFASILSAFSGDDVIVGLVRSLEDAPDH